MDCRITNDEFLDGMCAYGRTNTQGKASEDRGLEEICKVLWIMYYDPINTYTLSGNFSANQHEQALLRRIRLFLLSGLHYSWPELRRPGLIETSTAISRLSSLKGLWTSNENSLVVRIPLILTWPLLSIMAKIILEVSICFGLETGPTQTLYGMRFSRDQRYAVGDISVWPFHNEEEYQRHVGPK